MAKQKMEYECVCGQTFLTETGRNNHQKKCKMAKSFAEEAYEDEAPSRKKISERDAVREELENMNKIAALYDRLSVAGKHWVKSWLGSH